MVAVAVVPGAVGVTPVLVAAVLLPVVAEAVATTAVTSGP